MAIEVLDRSTLRLFWVEENGRVNHKEIMPVSASHRLFFNNEHKTIWGYEPMGKLVVCHRLDGSAITKPMKHEISKLIGCASVQDVIFGKVLDNGDLLFLCEIGKSGPFGGYEIVFTIFNSSKGGLIQSHSISRLVDVLGDSDEVEGIDYTFTLKEEGLVVRYNQRIESEEEDEEEDVEYEYVYKRISVDGNGELESIDADNQLFSTDREKAEPVEFELKSIGTVKFTRDHDYIKSNTFENYTMGSLHWNITTSNAHLPNGALSVIQTNGPNTSTESIRGGEHSRSLEQRISDLEATLADIWATLENMRNSS